MSTTPVKKFCYTILEAAQALGVSDQTIARRIKDGSLQATRLGKRLLLPASEIEKFGKVGA